MFCDFGRLGRLGLAAATACIVAVGADARSLEDELRDLLATHPELKAAEGSLASSQEGVRESRGTLLPNAVVTGDTGREVIDSPGRRDQNLGSSNLTRGRATLTVTQNLFTGFRNQASRRTADLNLDLAQLNLNLTRQTLLFQGVEAYLEVLRQFALVDLARENERTTSEQLALEDERVIRGSGIAVDVLFAKARLQIAKERRVAFEGAQRDAITRYIQVFGRAPELAAMARPRPPSEQLPTGLDGALAIARVDRINLKSSLKNIDVAEQRRRIAKADLLPSIDVVGIANVENNVDAERGVRRDYSILLRLNWEIFSGFATQAAVSRAAFDRAVSQDNAAFTRRGVEEDVALSWQALQTAEERVALLENAVAIAGEVFDARVRLRDAGRETAINVLDAESEGFAARINLAVADFDREVAKYRLLLAIGRLTPASLGLADR